ncbi:MAG: FMN phosphatase YigB (HAD superfamily) [bacterium]|jgi:FMN phosphatase YigB (HAD superfamily)
MPEEQLSEKTFRMPKLNYYIRKVFRPKVLVFDLDDTICLWPQNLELDNGYYLNFNEYMGNVFAKYTSEILGIDRKEAFSLCEMGFRKHHSSIIGLLKSAKHNVTNEQADEIFEKVHLHVANHKSKGAVAWAKSNPKLTWLLTQLKTSPYVFTHGSTAYAKIMLELMGLLNTVIPEENVFGLEQFGYVNHKMMPASYLWFQQKVGLPFNRYIMHEDSKKNLYWAKQFGMKTVWLQKGRFDEEDDLPEASYADHSHNTLEDYLEMFLQKGVSYTEEKFDRSVFEIMWENQTLGASQSAYNFHNDK